MRDIVEEKQLFVPFPNEFAEGPSKAQLKKLAKLQEAQAKKDAKKAGANNDPKPK